MPVRVRPWAPSKTQPLGFKNQEVFRFRKPPEKRRSNHGNKQKEGETTNGSVRVSWDDEDVMSSTVSLNGGEPVDFANVDTFDKEGTYRIEVKDDLGNTTIKEFIIDKTVDYEVVTSDGKTIFGDATTSSDVSINLKETGDITILKDGEKYSYSDGGLPD